MAATIGWEDGPVTSYCGAPPAPAELWSRWNLDPVLIAALAAGAALYAICAANLRRQGRGLAAGEQAAFYLGWAVAAAALISPLCALSVALFAARVGQHMVLTLLAAPLVAAGRPAAVLAGVLSPRARPSSRSAALLPPAALFAVLLWFWHAPVPYAATFAGTVIYWAMHLTLFGAALFLWSGLLDRRPGKALPASAAALFSSVQMSFLGALITFTPRPVYAPHFLTTAAWGLTALQDQQLGGAIMWIPGCLVFLAVSLAMLRLALARQAAPNPGAAR
jgi:putative membrane protein